MYPFRFLAVFFCLTVAMRAGDAPRKLAFERDGVYVANLDGTSQKKIAEGANPHPSPDGTHLAFNTETNTSAERHIAIADLSTGRCGRPTDPRSFFMR
jgi:TolB protein